MKKRTETDINDTIRKATDSSIQSLSNVVYNVKKDVNDVKTQLDNITKKLEQMNNDISPVINAFRESEEVKMIFKKKGETVVNILKGVMLFGGAIAMVWAFIKYIILQALR
jgi:uncharacterized coiled-coil protein SlyX